MLSIREVILNNSVDCFDKKERRCGLIKLGNHFVHFTKTGSVARKRLLGADADKIKDPCVSIEHVFLIVSDEKTGDAVIKFWAKTALLVKPS